MARRRSVTSRPAARLLRERTRRGDFDADDSGGRRQRLDRDPDAADQPAAADRDDHRVESTADPRAARGRSCRRRQSRPDGSRAKCRCHLPPRRAPWPAAPPRRSPRTGAARPRLRRMASTFARGASAAMKTDQREGAERCTAYASARPWLPADAVTRRWCAPSRPLGDLQHGVERAADLVRARRLDRLRA